MKKNSTGSNAKDEIKAENDFMKMKLMLERGAFFGGADESIELPPEVENAFLKNVIEFEKQFEEHKTIKLYEKVGKPTQFKPPSEIPEEEIAAAWEELSTYLQKYNINLDACSPNISKRELYRFTIEELFECEIDDINVPGMLQCFIYDEFHPDHVYNNARTAMDSCIRDILSKLPARGLNWYIKENLRLNGDYPLDIDEFEDRIDQFKNFYDKLELERLELTESIVNENKACVKGSYRLTKTFESVSQTLTGDWRVSFEFLEELDDWHINAVEIEKINFNQYKNA